MRSSRLEQRQNVLPWCVMIGVVLGGYWWLLGHWSAWESTFLLPEGPGAWFPDTYSVLAAGDMHETGFSPYGHNPLGIQHLYPRSWFALTFLGLGRSDSHWLGLLIGASMIGASLVWLRPRTFIQAGVGALCLLSPPVTLGFQRGNVDNLLYLVAFPAIYALLSPRVTLRVGLGVLLIFFGTLLKFYPIFGAVAVWWREEGCARLAVVSFFVLLLAVFGPGLWDDYNRIIQVAHIREISNGRLYSFGSSFDPVVRMVGFCGVAASLAAVVFGWLWLKPRIDPVSLNARSVAFLLGGSVLLGCFSVGTHFAYRLVFVLLMIPYMRDFFGGASWSVRWIGGVMSTLTVFLLWRDALVAVLLQCALKAEFYEFHRLLVACHRPALAAVQWIWVSVVAAVIVAMLFGRRHSQGCASVAD